jgi:hypothetical protein
MKGIAGGIPSYLYVIVALIVGIIMLLIVSRYSSILFGEKNELELTGGEEEISRSLSEIIQKCWTDNRRGLEGESSICKVVKLADTLKIEEINVTKYLDCEKLPNIDCYLYPDNSDPNYDCSSCSSPYFEDTDKIIWLAEEDNTEVKISYHGGSRKIVVVGYPCGDNCMCERDCKQRCIDGLSNCQTCYNNCLLPITITSTTSTSTSSTSSTTLGGVICANTLNQISKDKCGHDSTTCQSDDIIDTDCDDDPLRISGNYNYDEWLCLDNNNCCQFITGGGDENVGQCAILDLGGPTYISRVTYRSARGGGTCDGNDMDVFTFSSGNWELPWNNVNEDGTNTLVIDDIVSRVAFCPDHEDCDIRIDWIKYELN